VSAPQKVVAVVNAKAIRGYPYLVAAVYELAPRSDGVLTYRKSDVPYARPHRSERLAVADAEALAKRMGVPYWRHVRHHMTAAEAMARHGE